jgi:hypothetical protein
MKIDLLIPILLHPTNKTNNNLKKKKLWNFDFPPNKWVKVKIGGALNE